MNQKMKKAGFLFLVPFFALNAVAQAERTVPEKDTTLVLMIDGAVERAMESHVDIQRAKITLGKTERESKHAWNQVLPSVSANGSAAENGSWHDIESDTVSASAGVSASLSVNAELAPAIRALKSSYEAGKISFEDTVRSTEVAVRKQFYHLLYLQENLETSRNTLESYQKQYDQTSEKYRRGVVPELDLLTAQVNLETARPDVDSARVPLTQTALPNFSTRSEFRLERTSSFREVLTMRTAFFQSMIRCLTAARKNRRRFKNWSRTFRRQS